MSGPVIFLVSFVLGALVASVIVLYRALRRTTDLLVETTAKYGTVVDELGDTVKRLDRALNVCFAARDLLQYTDRSVESFYGNTAAPTVQEQALARTFEVERNTAISRLRTALKNI